MNLDNLDSEKASLQFELTQELDIESDLETNLESDLEPNIDIIESEIISKTKLKSLSKYTYFLPLVFIIIVVPLITHGKIMELTIEEANFWKGGFFNVDFFSYYKSSALVMATCIAFGIFGLAILKRKTTIMDAKIYYIAMGIYALFVILSTVFSKNINTAIVGFVEMYQGMSVLLSYILLTFITMNSLKSNKHLKIVLYSYVALSIIIGLLGLSQYFGYDFLQTTIGRALITPQVLKGANLKFNFGKYTIYATMYNTNFVGSFGAIVLPITSILFLNANNKDNNLIPSWQSKFSNVIYYISALLSFSTWLGCNSRAGYIGIISASIVGLIIFRKVIKEKYKKVLLLLISFALVTLVFNFASGGRVSNQFARLNPALENEKFEKLKEDQKIRFEEISLNNNAITIKTTSETLIGKVENGEIGFEDESGQKLETFIEKKEVENENEIKVDEVKVNEEIIKFIDNKYKEYSFTIKDGSQRIEGNIYNKLLHLYYLENDTLKIVSSNNKLTEPITAPRVKLFDYRETFASNRGYIWSRSIPMLKDTIVLGVGPDNFCYAFPQEDYVGRFNTGRGMTDIIVDKPHNMYLQTAINTGGVSLLALLIMWAYYIIDSLKLYLPGNIKTFEDYMGAGIFLSVTAYLVAGIFNDNIISVAPLFWVILGVGIYINKNSRH